MSTGTNSGEIWVKIPYRHQAIIGVLLILLLGGEIWIKI